ncbi:putative s- glutathione dehydrogenase protein [Neofusicoccum parvum UCRNP2]|uniref:Putative s-glutathione dehydrogenase protein n=1 Tax=Botryosphaeria parva (strain UCR-NP2) TaxID=1287680 RepID=R1GBS7_BOTPV|nr:putative s- glutathione dehydrogenase protein [Neofusicoccum parvum UCRNP2]
MSSGECFYCKLDLSSRCVKSQCFGTPGLPGAQAEYAPDGIKDQNLILMADIFPTGYFAALNAVSRLPKNLPTATTAVVIGCGPVGLCALVALSSLLAGTQFQLFAVDSIPSRLARAQDLVGAVPVNFKEEDVAERLQMGRCPVRSLFPKALEVLKENQANLECLTENIIPLTEAVSAYERFNRAEVQKFVFKVDE